MSEDFLKNPAALFDVRGKNAIVTGATGAFGAVAAKTLAAAGATLGGLCALFTHLRRGADGTPLSRAGWVAAILWVVGIGARMGFAWATTHGAGPAIERFSIGHSITTVDAWVAALFLMALAEVVTRLVAQGITFAPLTLDTGVSSLEGDEEPYPEPFDVPPATARLVNLTRRTGGRVIAAGTTVVRALESGQLAGYAGDVWFPQPAPKDHPWRTMPHHGMTPHISGTSLSAQARYAAGTREILECWFENRPIRDEYLIVDKGKLAGTGAHSYSAGNTTRGSEEAANFKAR